MTASAITLYGTPLSGHCHRVEQLLISLGLPYTYTDAPAAIRTTPEFLRLNPLGQIPVLTDGEVTLADSAAIMVYLVKKYAPGSRWLPEDPLGAAAVQRWLAIAAGEIKFGPATARVAKLWGDGQVSDATARVGARVMDFMEQHLAQHDWLAADHPTIADLACYAYVAHAPEGGMALEPYPAVRAWLARVESLPNFKSMPASKPRAAA